MILQTIQEIEDLYMNFRQSLTFDKIFTKEIVESLDPNAEYTQDESQNRTRFSCTIENYNVKGYLESSKIVLSCERRNNKKCVENFLEKVNEL